ncbi:MAG: hypothetical protein US53_C0021G0006 [Candidatus Woesebacteria bacterium GW2011_GWA1_37_7]|uniref:Uncharacterized protein n=1 Tax=Candidatus Woesebacteria bacterium GW2011_GWA1_37_7 TaxID=1618545 RepID=A0A0G0HFL5_9BACT|nr:MAG: hypothetical protein US53_C0021G0006 [Candidatus Woesebacteria bacterium GW2011_GWA1_37_7]
MERLYRYFFPRKTEVRIGPVATIYLTNDSFAPGSLDVWHSFKQGQVSLAGATFIRGEGGKIDIKLPEDPSIFEFRIPPDTTS